MSKNIKTELTVKANKIKVKATQKANALLAVASSLDFAQVEAFRRTEMRVIRAVKESDETLNAIQGKIDANAEKGQDLREQFDTAYKAAHPFEYKKEACLKEIKAALISFLKDRKAVKINGVEVKTYADARAVYQAVIEQKATVAVATNTQ